VWKEERKLRRRVEGKGGSGRKRRREEEKKRGSIESNSIPAEEQAQHNRDSKDKCACPVW
jgi:hypothetical protein